MLIIGNVTLEITKKCNLHCAHCMKGEPKNEELNLGILPKLFKKTKLFKIYNLQGEKFF